MPAAAIRRILPFLAAILLVVTSLPAQAIPSRLGDGEFWKMVADFSEPNGYFQSENMLSNETGYQMVIPELLKTTRQGGVYLGVGPEQNFTYIAAMHPAIAFITDIRHQNAMQHLLYKALIEMSDNRADFLARLFSRPRPAGLNVSAGVDTLFAAFAAVPQDSAMFYRTLTAVNDRLVKQHGFQLSAEELQTLEHNFDTFYEAGPDLSYNFNIGSNNVGRGGGGRRMPTYTDLMTQTNAGINWSYLGSDKAYQAVRDLELRNLIVPLTGDFAGPKALRAVAQYLKEHHATVSAFYTSNVEQYLFQNGVWAAFYKNVEAMPLDSASTFIRSGGGSRGFGGGGPGYNGMRSSLLEPIQELVRAFEAGRVQSYQDVLSASH
jgi:hypothetical protein